MTTRNINKTKEFFQRTISHDQAKDTGMAMVLICLLIAFFGKKPQYCGIAIILLLADMIWPAIYQPMAKIWLGFSHIMGTVMSKVILTIVFFVLVTPLGYVRGIMGKDSLQLKKWKKDRSSAFRNRNHTFKAEDIEHPY